MKAYNPVCTYYVLCFPILFVLPVACDKSVAGGPSPEESCCNPGPTLKEHAWNGI